MNTISLATYTIRVLPRSNDHYLRIDKFGPGIDLYDVINDYLTLRGREMANDRASQIVLQVEQIDRQVNRRISGIILRGEYGIESNFWDIEQQTINYKRDENDAEMLPFYYRFVLPANTDEGILILQQSGVYGIKELMEREINRFFPYNDDFRIEIRRLIPAQLLDQYFQHGRVTKVRFIKFGIPTDITDSIDTGHEEHEGMTELQVSAKRGRSFTGIRDFVRDFLAGRRDIQEFVELRNFEYDNIKVEVAIGGKYKTINLQDPSNLRAEFDVTDQIEIEGGQPVYESVDKVASDLARNLIEGLGFNLEGDVQQN